MNNVNTAIQRNITQLRKNAKLTQLEFAEKINYSDKTVSKWETGESVPSVETLYDICLFFGITINDIVSESFTIEKKQIDSKKLTTNKIIIICLVMLTAVLIATVLYVYIKILWNKNIWMVFVWTVPICSLLSLIFNSIWGVKRNIFIFISITLWATIAAVYLQCLPNNLWPLFLVGAPVQVAMILWSQLQPRKKQAQEYVPPKEKIKKVRVKKSNVGKATETIISEDSGAKDVKTENKKD